MIDYLKCIQKIYPGFTENDVSLEDHGNGDIIISYWNPTFGSSPTISHLETVWLDVVKENKKLEMKEIAYDEINNGTSGYNTQYLTSNFKIDSSRFDLDNLKNLMLYSQLVSITSITIKDYNNEMHTITVSELQTIINELIGYGLWLYQHKWEKEYEIDQCTTIEAVNAITFL